MSVNLLVEVRDHAPADLTPAEVLALVWIAEQSRDEDRWTDNGAFVAARTCFPGSEELARWCHVSETGLRKVFARLADRGLDVRVQQATDKNGKPVYAIKGRRMVLRLPVLGDTAGSPNDENRTLGDTQGSPEAIPQGPLGRYPGVPSGDTTGSPTLDLSRDLSRDVPLLSVASATATTNTAVAILDDEPSATVQGEVITEATDERPLNIQGQAVASTETKSRLAAQVRADLAAMRRRP